MPLPPAVSMFPSSLVLCAFCVLAIFATTDSQHTQFATEHQNDRSEGHGKVGRRLADLIHSPFTSKEVVAPPPAEDDFTRHFIKMDKSIAVDDDEQGDNVSLNGNNVNPLDDDDDDDEDDDYKESVNVNELNEKVVEDLAKIQEVSKILQEQKAKGDIAAGDGNPEEENPNSLHYLQEDVEEIAKDLTALVESLNATKNELTVAKEAVKKNEEDMEVHLVEEEAGKIIDSIQKGKVEVDYETGKLKEKKEGDLAVKAENSKDNEFKEKGDTATGGGGRGQEEEAIERSKPSKPLLLPANQDDLTLSNEVDGKSENISAAIFEKKAAKKEAKIERQKELQGRVAEKVAEEITKFKDTKDPAVMQVDVNLLFDIVALAIAAALGGLWAVWFNLPATAGFLLGGMVIGPSCWDLVEEIKQVQTLASFGSIFLLFEQGLLYSQQYGKRHISNTVPSSNNNSNANVAANFFSIKNVNMAGMLVWTTLLLVTAFFFMLGASTYTFSEVFIVSSGVALSSSTVVSETLHAAHLKESPWGSKLLRLVAIQDLIMIPLLAAPEVLHKMLHFEGESHEYKTTALHFFAILIFLRVSLWLGKHYIEMSVKAEKNTDGDLFTLSIVAFALTMATISEELDLSLEAGALFSGICLMRSPHIPKILTAINPITSVFGGMYVTSLGMIISPTFVRNNLGSIFTLVLVVGVVKLGVVCHVLQKCFDFSPRNSLVMSCSFAQISEGSLVILAKAQRLGFVGRQTYLHLIPTTCILLSLVPFSASLLKALKRDESVDLEGGSEERNMGGGDLALKLLTPLADRIYRRAGKRIGGGDGVSDGSESVDRWNGGWEEGEEDSSRRKDVEMSVRMKAKF